MAGWTKEKYDTGNSHTHWNMDVLNKLSEAADGELMYNGETVCDCDEEGGLAYAQTNLTGVTSSAVSPKVVNIDITKTTDYCTVPTWLEYFIPGETALETKYTFDDADAAAFDAASDQQVLFDGTMHLQTEYADAFMVIGTLSGNGQYSQSVWVDSTEWKMVEKVEVL